jgi:hypothetical protein
MKRFEEILIFLLIPFDKSQHQVKVSKTIFQGTLKHDFYIEIMILFNHSDFKIHFHLMNKLRPYNMHYGIRSAYLKLRFIVILKRIIPFNDLDFKYGLIAHF